MSRLAFTADPELSFWPTPDDVADDLVFSVMAPWLLPDGAGIRVLEPSAGCGALLRAVRARMPAAWVTAVEPDAGRAEQLRAARAVVEPIAPAPAHACQQPGVPLADEVVRSTLEDYLTATAVAAFAGEWRPFDLVIANPPFTLPGRPEVWAEHLLAIYNDPHLTAPGAVVAAVVPQIVLTGRSKLVRVVRGLVDRCGAAEPCDRGAFGSTGAQVSTALLWTQKPFDDVEVPA